MARLNEDARNALSAAGLTMAAWTRRHFGTAATSWRGDSCGCPDDRCIGYHHDAQDECQCLPALLAEVTR